MRNVFLILIALPCVLWGQSVVIAPDKIEPTLINGTPVAPGTWTSVVRIKTGSSGCTATVVGKRVVLTAAHCASNGATSSFVIGSKTYSGVATRSPLYPGQDHDVCAILTSEDIDVKPSSIGGKAEVGKEITILGYGCTQPGGGGGNDGILRIGTSKITGFSGYDVVSSNKPNGAALCYGDSGGPLYDMTDPAKPRLLGINSKGNIKDTNYNARLDIPESNKFLTEYAAAKQVEICGVNKDCDEPGPQPGPDFVVENDAVKFSVKNKGVHPSEYVKRYVEMLADFLMQKP